MGFKVLVIGEHNSKGLAGVTSELIRGAAQLAGTDGLVEVVFLGHQIGQMEGAVDGLPVATVYLVDTPLLDTRNSEVETKVLRRLVIESGASLVLMSHGYLGIEVAPQLAGALGIPVIANCTQLAWDGTVLRIARPVFGGIFTAEADVSGPFPVVATVPSGALVGQHAADAGTRGKPEVVKVSFQPENLRTRVVDVMVPPVSDVDITGADVIVSVGRGVGDPSALEPIFKLAAILKGEVGCSRPLADMGWLPTERQVGLSGRTVAPKVYLALGISGAAQHLAGMSGAKCVIAVNNDPDAPIFQAAHYAVVEDLSKLVPMLISKAESAHR